MNPVQRKINFDSVSYHRQLDKSKRICFATRQTTALKRSEKPFVGSFTVPFLETIYPIFQKRTNLELFKTTQHNNYWRSIRKEEEYSLIEKFVDDFKNLVFLRDSLALSVAISEHMTGNGIHSKIGALEKNAKWNRNRKSADTLSRLCIGVSHYLPYYNGTNVICSVPPSKEKEVSLPNYIAQSISKSRNFENLTNKVRWLKEKPTLKEFPLEGKWAELDNVGIEIEAELSGKNIILIDDMYQSGTTMQYVAMKLQEAGAERIFGLAICKSMRDSDNQ